MKILEILSENDIDNLSRDELLKRLDQLKQQRDELEQKEKELEQKPIPSLKDPNFREPFITRDNPHLAPRGQKDFGDPPPGMSLPGDYPIKKKFSI